MSKRCLTSSRPKAASRHDQPSTGRFGRVCVRRVVIRKAGIGGVEPADFDRVPELALTIDVDARKRRILLAQLSESAQQLRDAVMIRLIDEKVCKFLNPRRLSFR